MPRTTEYLTAQNIGSKTKTWLETIRSTVKQRRHLVPEIGKSALIVIDMINYFATPGAPAYLPAAEPVKRNIIELTDFFAKNNRPVIFTKHCHKTGEGGGMLERYFGSYIRCSSEYSDIIEELQINTQKFSVVRKNTYDSFFNTELESILKQNKVSQTVITGVMTHLCCETTSRSAFVRGYEVYSIIDAMADSQEQFHINSLLNLSAGVTVTLSTSEFIKICINNTK